MTIFPTAVRNHISSSSNGARKLNFEGSLVNINYLNYFISFLAIFSKSTKLFHFIGLVLS